MATEKNELRAATATQRANYSLSMRVRSDVFLFINVITWIHSRLSDASGYSPASRNAVAHDDGAADETPVAETTIDELGNRLETLRSFDKPLVVAAYVPAEDEPGAALKLEVIDRIIANKGAAKAVPERGQQAASDRDEHHASVPDHLRSAFIEALDAFLPEGSTILLPQCPPGPAAPLHWAQYEGVGSLRVGRYGLLEPIGQNLGAEAANSADLVLVPGLAGDRHGNRLGRGEGYFDRSMEIFTSEVADRIVPTRTALLLFPDELYDAIAVEEHDLPVDTIITSKEILEIPA